MLRGERGSGTAAAFLGLALFCLFAGGILLVLMSGARVFKSESAEIERRYEERTVAQYIVTKLRSGDGARLEPFGDGTAIVVADAEAGCESYIYIYNGSLCELYAESGAGLSPEDGEKLVAAKAMTAELDGGLIHAKITSVRGRTTELWAAP